MTAAAAVPRRSSWIDMGRILATVMIVYFHVPSSLFVGHGHVGDWAHRLFENPRAALAFFFIFSGYFVKPHITMHRAASKAIALFLPYLCWNLICLPGLNDAASWQRIFGWGYPGPPCDYPLWFVRDLILLTLLAPCLQRYLPVFMLTCAVFTLWGNQWHIAWLQQVPFPTPGNALLYLSGLALSRLPLATLRARFQKSVPFLLVALAIYYAARNGGWLPLHASWTHLVIPFLLTSAILLVSEAILRLWPNASEHVAPWAPACFLVYAAHAPALILAGQATALLAPWALGNDLVQTAVPLAVVGCCLVAYRIMRRLSPGLLLPLICHEGRLNLPMRLLKAQ